MKQDYGQFLERLMGRPGDGEATTTA